MSDSVRTGLDASQPCVAAAGTFRPHDPNFEIEFERGNGSTLYDCHGKDYIDLVSGYSSNNFGHAHPQLVARAYDQLKSIGHLVGLRHPERTKLEQRLAGLYGDVQTTRVWLATTGARAVELAWKAAIARKPGKIVHFDLGFHGRSIATSQISCTSRIAIGSFEIAPPLAFPRCTRCSVDLAPNTCKVECLASQFEQLTEQASSISAIIVEPAIGARGYYFAPVRMFHNLRRFCDKHDICLISDEIQMGMGRMGSLMVCQEQGWPADLVVLGKSLAGGMTPLSAVIGKSKWLDAIQPGIESETFAASPLACGIANAALDLYDQLNLGERGKDIGRIVLVRLTDAFEGFSKSVTIEVRGAAIVIEFESDARQATLARKFSELARDHGVLVHSTGEFEDRVAIIPPLTITTDELELALHRLEKAIQSFEPYGQLTNSQDIFK